MTFITNTDGKISTANSSTATLTANSTFTGTAEDATLYNSVRITVSSDVSSAASGISFEQSSNGTNWDIKETGTFDVSVEIVFEREISVKAKFFRIVYTNGGTNQTSFRLQTKFHVSCGDAKVLPASTYDAFGRLRMSTPHTQLTVSHIRGKRNSLVYEAISGSATSTHVAAESCVTMATTGTGSVIRRSRPRGIYQPGKSLLVLLTGVLNNASNASTVTTKIGYYDDDGGYYFQYVNGTVSIVERTSVTGSLVETTVTQSAWNIDKMDGKTNVAIDVSKTLIYWMTFEWLGVGDVTLGVLYNSKYFPVHVFRHSNLLTRAYMQTASLPITYQIISTGGAGSMKQICGTVLSEGGFQPVGDPFSVNRGTSTISSGNPSLIRPVISIRLKNNAISLKVMARIISIDIIAVSTSNAVVELWRFVDAPANPTGILSAGTISWTSAGDDSAIEYDIGATGFTSTGGYRLVTEYVATNSGSVGHSFDSETDLVTCGGTLSDLFVLAVTGFATNQTFSGGITWREFI